MNLIVAGFASGAFAASAFIAAGMLMVFTMARTRQSRSGVPIVGLGSGRLIMAIVILSYPVWGVIGVLLGLAHSVLQTAAPGGGLGTSNLTYSLGVVTAFMMFAGALAYLLRDVWKGVIGTMLTIGVIFGWLIPAFAS